MYPKRTIVNGREYEINTDFKVAIDCIDIGYADIPDEERTLAIIYKLFGDKGLDNPQDWEGLIEKATKYLSLDKEYKGDSEPDMDFKKDYDFIKASFRSDYGINLDKEDMHWWEFYNLINGLSNSEFGNCCILNRIRNLRNMDTSKIEDTEEKNRIEEMQREFALEKKEIKTDKQKELDEYWKKMLGKEK